MRITFNKIVLGDFARDIPVANYRLAGARSVEVVELPEASEVEVFDRGNRSKRITFDTSRRHDSEAAAERFAHYHDEVVPIKGVLVVEGSFGGWRDQFDVAALVACQSAPRGVETEHSYEFVVGLSSNAKKGAA